MSVSRQQRRQQLLTELESVRHLLLEPDAASAAPIIPTLLEVMPEAPVSSEPLSTTIACEPAAQPATILAPANSELATPDAMQQLIAKLTQRQPQPAAAPNETVADSATAFTATDARADDVNKLVFSAATSSASALLFTASATPTATAAIESAADMLFQAVTEQPVFAAPNFTELELRETQFSNASPAVVVSSEAVAEPAAPSISAEDIDQLLFDILPAVEELLRERLSALLLKK